MGPPERCRSGGGGDGTGAVPALHALREGLAAAQQAAAEVLVYPRTAAAVGAAGEDSDAGQGKPSPPLPPQLPMSSGSTPSHDALLGSSSADYPGYRHPQQQHQFAAGAHAPYHHHPPPTTPMMPLHASNAGSPGTRISRCPGTASTLDGTPGAARGGRDASQSLPGSDVGVGGGGGGDASAALRRALDSEMARADALHQDLGGRTMEVQRLKVDLAAAKERARGVEDRLADTLDDLAATQALVSSRDAAIDRATCRLEGELESARADLARVESELAKVRDQHVEQSLQVSSLTAEAQRKDEQHRTLQAQAADRDAHNDALQARVAELQALLDGREADLRRNDALHDAAKHNAALLKHERQQADAEVVRLKAFEARNTALGEKVRMLEECLARAEGGRDEDASALKAARRRIEELEFKAGGIVGLQNELTDAQADVREHLEAVQALQAQLHDAEEVIARHVEADEHQQARATTLLADLRQAQQEKEAADGEAALLRLELTRLNTMEGQIKGLEAMMDTKDMEIRRLQDDAVASLDTIRRLEAAAAEVEPLNRETERLVHHYDDVEQRLAEAEARADAARLRGDELDAQVAKLEEIGGEKDAIIMELQGRVEALGEVEAAKERLEEAVAELKSSHADLEADGAAMHQHLAAARGAADDQTHLAAGLAQQLAASQGLADERGASLARLQEQHTAAARSVAELTSQNKALTADLSRQTRLVEDLKLQTSRLEDEATTAAKATAAAREREQRLASDADATNSRVADLEATVARATAEAAAEREEAARAWERAEKAREAERREQQARGQLEELDRSYKEKLADLHTREQECLALKIKLKAAETGAGRSTHLQNHVSDLKTSLERQRARVADLESQTAAKERRLQEVQNALEDERREMEQKNELQADLMERLKEFEVTLSEIEPRLAAKNRLEGKLAGVEADLQNKCDALDKAAADVARLDDRVQQLEGQLAAAAAEGARTAALQEELRTKSDMLRHLETEAESQRRAKTELRKEVDHQTHKAQLADDESQRLSKTVHDLEVRVKTLTGDLEDETRRAQDTARTDAVRIRRLEGDLAALNERSKDSASQTQLLADRRRANEDDLRRQKERIDLLEEEKGRAAVEWNDLCDQLRDERANAAKAYRDLNQLRADYERVSGELGVAQAKAAGAEGQAEQDARVRTQQVEAANRMVDELRLELEKVTCQQSMQGASLVREKEEVVRLEKRCRQQEDAIRRLEKTNADLRGRCDASIKQQRLAELRLEERERDGLASRHGSVVRAGVGGTSTTATPTAHASRASPSPYSTPLPKAVPTPLPLRDPLPSGIAGYSTATSVGGGLGARAGGGGGGSSIAGAHGGGGGMPCMDSPAHLHATRSKLQRLETELHALRRRQDLRSESRTRSPTRQTTPYTLR